MISLAFLIVPQPAPPVLVAPRDGQQNVSEFTTFPWSWNSAPSAGDLIDLKIFAEGENYDVTLGCATTNTASLLFTGLTGTTKNLNSGLVLAPNAFYQVCIRTRNGSNAGPWLSPHSSF